MTDSESHPTHGAFNAAHQQWGVQPVSQPTPVPRMPSEEAIRPRRYHHALRPVVGWWRGIVALIIVVAVVLILGTALSLPAMLLDTAFGWMSFDDILSGNITFGPFLMLANNLSLAALIPASMLAQWVLFGVRPKWISSVSGGFRWRWFWKLALVIGPVMAVYIGISVIIGPLDPLQFNALTITMLLVVLLTTPLQAAGEEYAARGLVQRSVSSWFASPVAAFIVSSIISAGLFMLAHGAWSVWLNIYYLMFAVAMGWAAWATGGLEAPVLIHVCNNLFVFIPTVLMGQMDSAFDRGAGVVGAEMLIPGLILTGVTGIAVWMARRSSVQTERFAPTRYRTR